jgi:NAD(P)-dependent dehydrogenase (short-subunit alcohol dehydrogenase family)
MKTLELIKKANGIRRRDIQWARKPLAPRVLTGKKMAVIGGTNGIGRALARTFAAKGRGEVRLERWRDEHAENIAPLIVLPDIEQFSGAMFNKRGEAIQPSPAMTDSAHVRRFMEASEKLARKVLPYA